MSRGELNGVVIGKQGLQHNLARSLAASRASRHLRQQLKGPLGGPEVRETQGAVGAHHAHQRDIGNVVSLGNHLRAHQQIDLARLQRAQHALKVVAPAHRVAIQSPNARLRKHAV